MPGSALDMSRVNRLFSSSSEDKAARRRSNFRVSSGVIVLAQNRKGEEGEGGRGKDDGYPGGFVRLLSGAAAQGSPLTEPGAGFILFTIKMNGHLFFIIV
jgi:hypothetical protein